MNYLFSNEHYTAVPSVSQDLIIFQVSSDYFFQSVQILIVRVR